MAAVLQVADPIDYDVGVLPVLMLVMTMLMTAMLEWCSLDSDPAFISSQRLPSDIIMPSIVAAVAIAQSGTWPTKFAVCILSSLGSWQGGPRGTLWCR